MSKEREAFEAWASSWGGDLTRADNESVFERHLAYIDEQTEAAWDSWQAATAHYQPLLEAKDAEIAGLLDDLYMTDELESFTEELTGENIALKALLEQAREAFEIILAQARDTTQWIEVPVATKALAAINAATGEKLCAVTVKNVK